MKYYSEDKDMVLQSLGSRASGLSDREAEERLAKYGKNALEAAKRKSKFVRFLEELLEPMTLILIAAAVISGVLAVVEDESFMDVIIIVAVVIINAVLGVYQESKAEQAIEALQKMSAAMSKVIRGGEMFHIHSEDLVPGDVIALEAGDAIPADCRIIECASLKAEESALTGESVPVSKTADTLPPAGDAEIPLGDRKNMVYMGSTAVYGRARAVVVATGMDTEMGKIAHAIQNAADGETPLQIKLNQLSKILTWLVLAICAVVFGVQLLRAGSLDVHFIIDSFMISVSLAVAAIPEGLAAVVTVVLSIGVTNMSRKQAIIRRLTAVETLGCAQIICSDKTGTLTQNKMTVVKHFGEDEKRIAASMALCSDAELGQNGEVTGEPTEAALVAWAAKLELNKNTLKEEFPRCGEAPFDSVRKMMSVVCRRPGGYVQYTKGAPDIVVSCCSHYLKDGQAVPMTPEYAEKIAEANKNMAGEALRILACAEKLSENMPSAFEPEALEQGLCFTGLCGMMDPVRPEVKDAIVMCRNAGIRPIMITGDHKDTAAAIAKELGILEPGLTAITGSELSAMSDAEFTDKFRHISVYARVQPEHKTRIVNEWRNAGHVTAMTGDGVNDAPSIKAADIGVGMGITGTDVTKNVADMVLADDNFATIVGAVEEGRRIYDNIRKAIQFLLGSNMSEVICIFTATLLGFTILKPVHLLWINLVTDSFPALALGLEKAESNIMRRRPRDAKAGIFSGGIGVDIAYQGILVSILVLIAYKLGGMTMAFITMSMAEVFHSFNLRSQRGSIFTMKHGNKYLLLAGLASILATSLVCEVPVLAAAFDLTRVDFSHYLTAVGLGALIIPAVEIVKFFQRKYSKNK